VAKLYYEMDGGKPNVSSKSPAQIADHLEDTGKQHLLAPPDRGNGAKAIRLLYKVRSSRNTVHLSDDHVANRLDAELVLALMRWLVSECLRLGSRASCDDITEMIRGVLVRDVPAVGRYGDLLLVERVGCSETQEILIVLYAAGGPMTVDELDRSVPFDRKRLGQNLSRLESRRLVIALPDETYQLTDGAGIKHVEEKLSDKLIL